MRTPADTHVVNTASAEPAIAIYAAARALPSFIAPAAAGMPDPVVTYHEDNMTVQRVKYCNADGELDRDDGPAWIEWYANGVKRHEGWWRDNNLDREDGAAITKWRANGVRECERWWRNGELDRQGGPAVTEWHANGTKSYEWWYRNDKCDRDGGPSITVWRDTGDKIYEGWPSQH